LQYGDNLETFICEQLLLAQALLSGIRGTSQEIILERTINSAKYCFSASFYGLKLCKAETTLPFLIYAIDGPEHYRQQVN